MKDVYQTKKKQLDSELQTRACFEMRERCSPSKMQLLLAHQHATTFCLNALHLSPVQRSVGHQHFWPNIVECLAVSVVSVFCFCFCFFFTQLKYILDQLLLLKLCNCKKRSISRPFLKCVAAWALWWLF